MKPLSPTARRLFELSHGQDEPDAPTRTRVAQSLAARIASGADVGAVGTSVPMAPASAGLGAGASTVLGSIVVKSVLVACVTGAVVAGGWLSLRSSRPRSTPERVGSPRPAVMLPKAPPRAEPSSEPSPVNQALDPGVATRRKPARLPPRPDPKISTPVAAPPADQLREETEALRSAQQALRDGDAMLALRLLQEQDAHFRSGVLQQERAAARVLALCQAGSVTQARVEAESFEQRWPRSALVARVRFACWKP